MLVEREADWVYVGESIGGVGEKIVEHGCPRPFALLHVHLTGLNEVAAVSTATCVDAESLLQVVAASLIEFVVSEVGEASIGDGARHKQRRLIQVEASAGRTLLGSRGAAVAGGDGRCGRCIARVRHSLLGRKAALQNQCEGVGEVELDVLVEFRNLRCRLGAVHLVRRHAVAEPLEHVAVLVQCRRNGVTCVALDAVLPGERRDRVRWLRDGEGEARRSRDLPL